MIASREWVVGGPTPSSANVMFAGLLLFVLLDAVAVRVATGVWTRVRSSQDQFTYWIIQVAQGLGLGLALLMPRWVPSLDIGGSPAGCVVPGAILIAIGSGIRVWSVLTLGRSFNREIEVSGDHQIVSDGPYHWVRHPSYTGVLVTFVGFSLGQANWLSLVAGSLLPIAGYVWRIRSEETVLFDVLGNDYRNYAVGRKRLLPGLY